MDENVLNLPLPWSSIQEALRSHLGVDKRRLHGLTVEYHQLNNDFPSEDDTIGKWWGTWARQNIKNPYPDARSTEISLRVKVLTILPKIYPDLLSLCDATLKTFTVTTAKNIAGFKPAWTDLQDQVQECVNALESRDSERIVTAKDALHAAIESKRQNPNLDRFELNGLCAMMDIMLSITTGFRHQQESYLGGVLSAIPNFSESRRTDYYRGAPDYRLDLYGEI